MYMYVTIRIHDGKSMTAFSLFSNCTLWLDVAEISTIVYSEVPTRLYQKRDWINPLLLNA